VVVAEESRLRSVVGQLLLMPQLRLQLLVGRRLVKVAEQLHATRGVGQLAHQELQVRNVLAVAICVHEALAGVVLDDGRQLSGRRGSSVVVAAAVEGRSPLGGQRGWVRRSQNPRCVGVVLVVAVCAEDVVLVERLRLRRHRQRREQQPSPRGERKARLSFLKGGRERDRAPSSFGRRENG
jgi:hypothetical protein